MAARKAPAKKKTATTRKPTAAQKAAAQPPKRREVGAIVCILLAIFGFLGFFTKDGWFIAWFNIFLKGVIGYGYYLAVPVLLLAALVLGIHKGRPVRLKLSCAFAIPVLTGAWAHLASKFQTAADGWNIIPELWFSADRGGGGIVGGLICVFFQNLFGYAGSVFLYIMMLLVCFCGAINITPVQVYRWWKQRERVEYVPEPLDDDGEVAAPVYKPQVRPIQPARTSGGHQIVDIPIDSSRRRKQTVSKPLTLPLFDDEMPPFPPEIDPLSAIPITGFTEPNPYDSSLIHTNLPPITEKPKYSEKEIAEAGFEVAESIQHNLDNSSDEDYVYPPTRLLTPASVTPIDTREEVGMYTRRLDNALRSFKISAEIVEAIRGPSITRYDVELEQGVKLNTLTNRADDIALSMGVNGVRVASVPDKPSTVGIEVPNKQVTTVHLREIIESREFQSASSKLTFAIGKDISGSPIVGDIDKLTHLLIAGTTGSGKSVCMNSLILSLLYKASPAEVRMIMIDPKMVEFNIYNGIPHLLIPVVTDPKKAAGALQWAVFEMTKRQKLFSEIGVRDITSYNRIMQNEGSDIIPRIVVLIDELNDLMMTTPKDVEESMARIAQIGRAMGIHLVVATQRPSADVITGTMKNNLPSRIAFMMASAINSRTILDQSGAEKLIGKGDMLYAPVGAGKPVRIQGTFVSDQEREDIIEFIKANTSANYSDDVLTDIESRSSKPSGVGSVGTAESISSQIDMFTNSLGGGTGAEPVDEMFAAAVDVMLETGQASVSMLQRRLKLGYGRASRIVDQMEDRGIVGPFDGAKPRQLLVTREEWEQRKNELL